MQWPLLPRWRPGLPELSASTNPFESTHGETSLLGWVHEHDSRVLTEEPLLSITQVMYDRMLNDYNGESWLNEEDEALEGAGGIFDLNILSLVSKFPKGQEQERQQKLLEAYHLLSQKSFLPYSAQPKPARVHA